MTISRKEIRALVAMGESETLEFKRSTGELREALQTVCAFANGSGGKVFVGVKPNRQIVGQQVSDQTLHEIADARDRFDPPVDVGVERVNIGGGLQVLVLSVAGTKDSVPCTFEGRSYERIANTTRKMSRERYEGLLLDRAHSRRRWENQIADEITIKDIDRDEVFRIVRIIESIGRLTGPSFRNLPDALDRLGLRKDGQLLRAAVILFGKTFLPDYPQCELRMARFRGTDKTEFMDQRQLRGPAFKLLEEAELFCQRHFPLPAKIVPGQMRRVETPLIPPDAMREIFVNALIHRDYSIAGGAVSLAIFDDRVEVWSAGKFPTGITPESLKGAHLSIQRNPIIADVFHRTGLIEKWGRGTNRVADMCRAAGIAPPEFEEITGAAVVTFRVNVLGAAAVRDTAQQPEAHDEAHDEAHEPMTEAERRILEACADEPRGAAHLLEVMGYGSRTGNFKKALGLLLADGFIAMTFPEKPRSKSQKYRLTAKGRTLLIRGKRKA